MVPLWWTPEQIFVNRVREIYLSIAKNRFWSIIVACYKIWKKFYRQNIPMVIFFFLNIVMLWRKYKSSYELGVNF